MQATEYSRQDRELKYIILHGFDLPVAVMLKQSLIVGGFMGNLVSIQLHKLLSWGNCTQEEIEVNYFLLMQPSNISINTKDFMPDCQVNALLGVIDSERILARKGNACEERFEYHRQVGCQSLISDPSNTVKFPVIFLLFNHISLFGENEKSRIFWRHGIDENNATQSYRKLNKDTVFYRCKAPGVYLRQLAHFYN